MLSTLLKLGCELLFFCHNLLLVQNVPTHTQITEFPPLLSCLRRNRAARGQSLPADPSWQEAILFLSLCVNFFSLFFFFFCTSRFLCVYAVTWWSLHVHWSIKFCRYRQQDSGTVPGVWQPLTLSLHLMAMLSCQTLLFWYFTTHTDYGCVPLSRTPSPPLGKLSNVEFVRWDVQTPKKQLKLCIFW